MEEFGHEAVRHSAGEYVRGVAHVNGLESFWALFKRGYHGTYHRVSPQHLQRYVTEFCRTAQQPLRGTQRSRCAAWCAAFSARRSPTAS